MAGGLLPPVLRRAKGLKAGAGVVDQATGRRQHLTGGRAHAVPRARPGPAAGVHAPVVCHRPGPAAVVAAVVVDVAFPLDPHLARAAAVEVEGLPRPELGHQVCQLCPEHARRGARASVHDHKQEGLAVFREPHGSARVAVMHVRAVGEAAVPGVLAGHLAAFDHQLGEAADQGEGARGHALHDLVRVPAVAQPVGLALDAPGVHELHPVVPKGDPAVAGKEPVVFVVGAVAPRPERPADPLADRVAVHVHGARPVEVAIGGELHAAALRPGPSCLELDRRPGRLDADPGRTQVDPSDPRVRRRVACAVVAPGDAFEGALLGAQLEAQRVRRTAGDKRRQQRKRPDERTRAAQGHRGSPSRRRRSLEPLARGV